MAKDKQVNLFPRGVEETFSFYKKSLWREQRSTADIYSNKHYIRNY
jgi:hypothetical protein